MLSETLVESLNDRMMVFLGWESHKYSETRVSLEPWDLYEIMLYFIYFLKQVCTEYSRYRIWGGAVSTAPGRAERQQESRWGWAPSQHAWLRALCVWRAFSHVPVCYLKKKVQDLRFPLLVQDRIKTETWLHYRGFDVHSENTSHCFKLQRQEEISAQSMSKRADETNIKIV